MSPGENMMERSNKQKSHVEQLESAGAPLLEGDHVGALSRSLADSYSNLIEALESGVEDTDMEFVTSRLLYDESKRKERLSNAEKGMISVKAKSKSGVKRVSLQLPRVMGK